MSPFTRPPHRRCFQVAIICALPREADAVTLLFDQLWDDEDEPYGRTPGDTNTYTTGRIGNHDVVLAVLPGMGIIDSAVAAANLRSSYIEIKLVLIVGICGGVPEIGGSDVFLGDVVISSALIRYDFGRQYPGHYAAKHAIEDSLGRPNPSVRGLLATLMTELGNQQLRTTTTKHLRCLQEAAVQAKRRNSYQYPGLAEDYLYRPEYRHAHQRHCGLCLDGKFCDSASKSSCAELECNTAYLVTRETRNTCGGYFPEIFVGRVGSGNTVMKSGQDRDQIAKTNNIIAFEMEGAGAWDQLPCLVVKGICDYADSHKNKKWQDFASGTAAAVAKAILDRHAPSDNSRQFTEERSSLTVHDIFHRQSPQAVIQSIPYPRNEDVISRPTIVDRLHKLLPQTNEYNSAALWGLGGSGKTQIALDFAYQRCKDPHSSVFWVHADSEATFSHDYKEIAKKLGVGQEQENEDLLAAVCEGIQKKPQWTLIVDNADDLALFGIKQQGQPKSLYQYIPRAPTGTVLWTSRDERIVGTLVGPIRGIQVPQMTPNEASELLETLGIEDASSQGAEILQLLKELQWFPLAISQAGAYMRRTSTSVRDYSRLLAEVRERWKLLEIAEFDRHRRAGMANSILETWGISIKYIQKESEMAYKLLNVIAYVDNQNIPHEIMTTAIMYNEEDRNQREFLDQLEVTEAITQLKAYSFIRKRQTEDHSICYEMHKLVQEATRYALAAGATIVMNELGTDNQSENSEARFSGIAVRVMLDLYPWSDLAKPETWILCEKYLAHAMQVSTWVDTCEKRLDISNLLGKVSIFLFHQGRWREKELVDQNVLQFRREILGEGHPDTLIAIVNLASTYANQGLYSKAEAMEIKVLELRKEILGERHPSTLRAIGNLAITYRNQGLYSKAEAMEIKVLELRKEILGERHPHTLLAMENLTSTYSNQGLYSKAEAMEIKVLELRKEILGERHPDTLLAMANLASTYENQGLYSKAEAIKIKVLELSKEILGDGHPDTLLAMANLAVTYGNQGLYSKAEAMEIKVLELRKEILGEGHPHTLIVMANLAVTYQSQGLYSKAEALETKVLELRKEILGDRHPQTLRSINNLAVVYKSQGLYGKAEGMGIKSLELRKEVLGDRHYDTLVSKLDLSKIYYQQRRLNEAETLNVEALCSFQEIHGEKHPDTILSMVYLSSVCFLQGRYDEAESIVSKAYSLSQERLGENHPYTLDSMVQLSRARCLQGRHDEAKSMISKAYSLSQELRGEKHPGTLQAMHEFAIIQVGRGRHKDAISLMEQCFEFRCAAIGPDHPHTKESAELLETWRNKHGVDLKTYDQIRSSSHSSLSASQPTQQVARRRRLKRIRGKFVYR